MSFDRPTRSAIIARIGADFTSRLSGADSRVPRNNIDVQGKVYAAAIDSLYAAIALQARFFPAPDNAEANARWGSILNVPKKAPTSAAGPAGLVGTNGITAPAGSVLLRVDGARFTIDADVTIAGGVASPALTAELPGSAGNTDTGQQLTFLSPIAGINAVATVAAPGLAGGADEELEADYCGRILERMRTPPAGGTAADYERWAKEVPGVTRAWVTPNASGLGTVLVQFVMDGRVDIIPAGGDVTAVDDYIADRRPVTADVTVSAPIATPLDFTFSAITPTSVEVEAAVEAELRDLLSREAEPGGTILISHIREAISIAAGESDYVLTTPNANVTVAAGHISTMGTVTWP